MIKSRVALVLIGSILLSILLSYVMDLAFLNKNDTSAPIANNLQLEIKTLYVGNKSYNCEDKIVEEFDICTLLGYGVGARAESQNPDIATVDNNIIKFHSTGDLFLTITVDDQETQTHFKAIEGINIVNARQFEKTLTAVSNEAIILQKDFSLMDEENDFVLSKDNFTVKVDLYGNGFVINCENYADTVDSNKSYEINCLKFKGINTIVRDLKIIGKYFSDGDKIVLENITNLGSLAFFEGEDSNISVVNCVFENGYRNAFINKCDVEFIDCRFMNAADSCVSIAATKEGQSNIVFDNCAIGNGFVSGITCFCKEELSEQNQNTITFKRNVDFYCWKDASLAKIVPTTITNYETYNKLFSSFINLPSNGKFVIKYENKKYINCAMLVVCTNKNSENIPVINGVEEQGLEKIDADNPILEKVFTTCDWYSYQDTTRIAPTDIYKQ